VKLSRDNVARRFDKRRATMPITTTKDGTVIHDGEKATRLFQLKCLRMALNAQARGMQLTRGVTGTTAAKRLGFKGRTVKELLPQVEARIAELDPTVVRVVEQ
jgi:hypothetical protein